MDDLDKVKSQIDNGQGLTCAQARLLWGYYSEASRYAAYALGPYTPTLRDWQLLQNSYCSPEEQGSGTLSEIFRLEDEEDS